MSYSDTATAGLPNFSSIDTSAINSELDKILKHNNQRIDQLLAENSLYTWQNLVAPLEQLNDTLANFWSPVSHLNAVCNSDELRVAYNQAQPKLSAYYTHLGQNHELYTAYQQLQRADLNSAQNKVLDNALRDFKLSGVALAAEQQRRFAEIKLRTSELGTKFSENVLDSTQAWQKHITDVQQLAGMPELALAAAKQAAQAKELPGYLLTLEFPSYLPVMTYCDNRALRQEMYTAFATRASTAGENASQQQWDNSPIIEELLALRKELATILGFDSYAHYSLATKMADSPDAVLGFLNDLAQHSVTSARAEFATLRQFAAKWSALEQLQAWDVGYYAEKLKLQKFSISQEQLRPYFPMHKVLQGLFSITSRLFDFQITEIDEFDAWHSDVKLFQISRDNKVIARFYLDPFARANKRGGAWMDVCRTRRIDSQGELQLPTAYLVCNFNAPVGNDPALLTHDELTTLFHEFGHGLHHMMTEMQYADISGINGVPWDAVELPSQFLENWCWQPQALSIISGHFSTGETLPAKLLDNLLEARNFQSAMTMVRQLEFSLFDYRLHLEYQPGESGVQPLLDQIRQQVAAVIPPTFNSFQNSFSHIFAGGYAAGYYSYKWAEVLSADAFSLFEEKGIFHKETGQLFLSSILQKGGSEEPLKLFVDFRGREPDTEALLRHSGIVL
ncbi:MAG: M3 family metallopeptidase [Pseudomonadales bacterium]|nr:M3 family metallopeptidase [Pseudomonadales bacterium]NRA15731.1 M3 family metallopeptidase [Oceanospirillaceae bacterium]